MDSERSRSIGHEDAVTLDGQFPGMAPAPSGKRVERKQHLVAMDSFGKGYSALTKNQREEVDVAISKGDK
jgi:hypothetical protein